MKKIMILICACIIACTNLLFAQIDLGKTLPLDSTLRKGVLSNGMTYYIKYNDYPKGHANFQIFHKIGALEEENNQNGLAHFLEHLAFNGLQHFPGKSMLDYMEKNGIKFGQNVNASTSQEYTQYMLNNVPVSRGGLIDTCLLVLHDWSGFILCEQDEIDAERGVIQEERRGRGGARLRISEAITQCLYKGSKYADRNVIGSEQVVDTFKREELFDFYKKWYYPNMQAVAVVGDIDVNIMEKKVKELFSTIPSSSQKIEKKYYTIPDNKKLNYATIVDKEATSTSAQILFKHNAADVTERNTGKVYIEGYYRHLVCSMMNNRLNDILKREEYPAKGISYEYSSLSYDKDVFALSVDIKKGEENIKPAIEMALGQTQRFIKYGFIEQELERVKSDALRAVEKKYIERSKQSHSSFTNAYLSNFIKSSPILSMEYYYKLLKEAIADFTLDKANNLVKTFIEKENVVAFVVANTEDKAGIPCEKEMEKYISGMSKLQIKPYSEKILPKTIISPENEPVPGKVVSSEPYKFGARLWTLSNGAKVYILPRLDSKDEIQVCLYDWGGRSVVKDEDYISSLLLSTAMTCSGAGDFDEIELAKMLSGKIVYATPLMGEYYEAIDCATSSTDYESLLQLIYLYLTQPRFNQEKFNRELTELKENLIARKKEPFSTLVDSTVYIRENYHKRASSQILNPDDVDKVDYQVIKRLYKEHFNNPADFEWFFVGAVDTVAIKPVIEKYIGGLKSNHHADMWRDLGKRAPVGERFSDFTKKMETPKATTFIEYTSEKCDYSFKMMMTMQLIKGILDIRFTDLIREKMGGTYSVDTEGNISQYPVPIVSVIVSFTTNGEMMDTLRSATFAELKRLSQEGVDMADFVKSREYIEKSLIQGKDNILYWKSVLFNYVRNGFDMYTDDVEILHSITVEDINSVLKAIIEENNVVSITMRPE